MGGAEFFSDEYILEISTQALYLILSAVGSDADVRAGRRTGHLDHSGHDPGAGADPLVSCPS